jgi:uncharacterized protein YajQ (UPF0234 family)
MDELIVKGMDLQGQAKALEITTPETFEIAGGYLKAIKALGKEVGDTFKPVIAKAHEAHKAALEAMGKHQAPLDDAERALKGKMTVYVEAERAKARAEQARLEAIERKRIEDERIAEAQEMTESGRSDIADQMLDAPVVVAPVKVQAEIKLDGVHFSEKARADLVDLMALVKAVAAGTVPLEALSPNMPALNAWARAGREIPGVKIIIETIAAARSF